MTRDDVWVPAPTHRVAADVHARIDALLTQVDADLAARFPGDRDAVQPVHTVYIGAADADEHTPRQWGEAALELLERHADLLTELSDGEGDTALALTRKRLADAPIADLRLDFEDGYGRRSDDVEDADALRAGETLRALGLQSSGVRIKGLTMAERTRAVRTLELVLDGGIPDGFVFTVRYVVPARPGAGLP